jgi:hypothetical protein
MRPGNGPASRVIARRRAEMMTNARGVVFPPPPPPHRIPFQSTEACKKKVISVLLRDLLLIYLILIPI